MEELEKKIEEAADKYSDTVIGNIATAFINGAKSPEAKAFHTQGMYTEIEQWIAEAQPQLIHSRVSERQIGYSNALLDLSRFLEQNKKKP